MGRGGLPVLAAQATLRRVPRATITGAIGHDALPQEVWGAPGTASEPCGQCEPRARARCQPHLSSGTGRSGCSSAAGRRASVGSRAAAGTAGSAARGGRPCGQAEVAGRCSAPRLSSLQRGAHRQSGLLAQRWAHCWAAPCAGADGGGSLGAARSSVPRRRWKSLRGERWPKVKPGSACPTPTRPQLPEHPRPGPPHTVLRPPAPRCLPASYLRSGPQPGIAAGPAGPAWWRCWQSGCGPRPAPANICLRAGSQKGNEVADPEAARGAVPAGSGRGLTGGGRGLPGEGVVRRRGAGPEGGGRGPLGAGGAVRRAAGFGPGAGRGSGRRPEEADAAGGGATGRAGPRGTAAGRGRGRGRARPGGAGRRGRGEAPAAGSDWPRRARAAGC